MKTIIEKQKFNEMCEKYKDTNYTITLNTSVSNLFNPLVQPEESTVICLSYNDIDIFGYNFSTEDFFIGNTPVEEKDKEAFYDAFDLLPQFKDDIKLLEKESKEVYFLTKLSEYIEKKYEGKYIIPVDENCYPENYYPYVDIADNGGYTEFTIALTETEKGICSPYNDVYYTVQELKEQIDIYEKAVELNKKYFG